MFNCIIKTFHYYLLLGLGGQDNIRFFLQTFLIVSSRARA